MVLSQTLEGIGSHLFRTNRINNFFPQGNPINSQAPALVVVHPFYFGLGKNIWRYYQHEQLKSSTDYISNIKEIWLPDRNIILFETTNSKENTLNIIRKARGLDGVYLIETEPDNSTPTNAGLLSQWENMAKKILEVSPKFEFAGGEIYGNIINPDTLYGCLGGAFRNLKNYGVNGELKHGCCYKSTEHLGWDF
jgi:hypothetical protein